MIDPVVIAAILASLLTAPGATIGAGIVNRVIEGLKKLAPTWVAGREKWWAIGISTVLVAIAYIYGILAVPPTQKPPWVDPLVLIVLPLVVYNIARGSMAFHDDLTRAPNSLTGPRVSTSLLTAASTPEVAPAPVDPAPAPPPVAPTAPPEAAPPRARRRTIETLPPTKPEELP